MTEKEAFLFDLWGYVVLEEVPIAHPTPEEAAIYDFPRRTGRTALRSNGP